jgi:hypothetical protein
MAIKRKARSAAWREFKTIVNKTLKGMKPITRALRKKAVSKINQM